MIDKIIDYRKTKDEIPKDQGTFKTRNGLTRKLKVMKEWEFYVRWKDRNSTWVKLKDPKKSHLIEIIDYITLMNIQDEPTFA